MIYRQKVFKLKLGIHPLLLDRSLLACLRHFERPPLELGHLPSAAMCIRASSLPESAPADSVGCLKIESPSGQTLFILSLLQEGKGREALGQLG